MRAEAPELLPGHRVRIIDGNRFRAVGEIGLVFFRFR
jgi:hypothetical protein